MAMAMATHTVFEPGIIHVELAVSDAAGLASTTHGHMYDEDHEPLPNPRSRIRNNAHCPLDGPPVLTFIHVSPRAGMLVKN